LDVAVSLGVPIVWLLGEDPTDMPATPPDAKSAKLRARLVTAFAMLGDDRLRHVALHAVEALAEVVITKRSVECNACAVYKSDDALAVVTE
jgi:hypothetical protein